ncbi:hypothetical protein H4N54_17255 [Limnospira fusiformis KN01]|uniref:Uncharacterized protein n=3 Tax=Limnospira TaxID=2596745 RepID=A0A9P1KDJ5_9CYAN|nr:MULTISPECIES: hypothetical protein [Limnospira]EKD11059.1 hypothetical protein SPLC1_S040560 [Arthrospira platensis C1]MDC0839593.1 hypothetical protein [Limnoraphis robusta]MDY7054829.1 hypothetical protein [Limnospira fusiformis LS22]QJB27747.1 hypothetical protein HFV01_20650 [Limnospira fusiformis SAG 85.79]EDZ92735.1 hypothetical protein AmaxDRAFT_4482 [Limnospira maxima CS-328]
MEHIANILPNVIPHINTAQNGLYPLVENAIFTSAISLDRLPYAVRWHIPAKKYSQAKGWLEELTRPAGGHNATFSHGNWWSPVTKTWVKEPIVLVKSYMTAAVLDQHLGAMLRGSYRMGRTLGEEAIALEILSHNIMLVIPTDTRISP